MTFSFQFFNKISSNHLLFRNKTNIAYLMSSIKSVLIDLSGTIHIENESIPGSIDALKRLREAGLHIKFVTNTTKESRRFLYERLINIGFQIDESEIYTSLWAARDLLQNEKLNPMLLVDDEALEDFAGIPKKDEKIDAVVIGLAPQHFKRSTLNDAFRVLIGGGRLIAIHEAKYYKRKDGLALGPGPFVKTLEYATGIKSTVVGKPNQAFFRGALDGILPEDTVMIGDDIQNDIDGSQNLGIRGYLVKTGKYRPGDETKISPPPFKCVDSFSLAVDHILTMKS